MLRTAPTPMVASRADQSADDDPLTLVTLSMSHSHPIESDHKRSSTLAISEAHYTTGAPVAGQVVPNMSSTADAATDMSFFQQLLTRLRPAGSGQSQQANQIHAAADITGRQTPERPLISPINSNFTTSRPPSTTNLLDSETAATQQHQQRLDSTQPEGEFPLFPNFTQNSMPATDVTDADLLAGLTASRDIASAHVFSPIPDTSSKIVDSLLQDGVEELGQPTVDLLQKAHDSGRVEAFAKLEFADGFFYMTTSSLELGRDERVYKAAQEKAREAELALRERPSSSSGQASHGPDRLKRTAGSQVKGSIISERGGFCAVDIPKAASEPQLRPSAQNRSHSSQMSASSVVKMEDLEIHRPIQRFEFDYQKLVDETNEGMDDEQPAPVTTAHMPKLESNPLIPIHPMTDNVDTEIGILKSVSRRHARIAWNEVRQCFEMTVLGRNGAFLNDNYLKWKSIRLIPDNSRVAISGIEFTFRLPIKHADSSDESEAEEEDESPNALNQSTTPPSEQVGRSVSPSTKHTTKTGANYKSVKKSIPVAPTLLIGPDGNPIPPKKRGPGRPPKDGIMSNRERRELAKAEKARQAREANGGVTPPPTGRGSINRVSVSEAQTDQTKGEKRKYTKRKRGEDGDVLPSIEGGQVDVPSDEEVRQSKQRKASKSPSPIYPAKETLTEEQMAKPQENYARMIYDVLDPIHPEELGLRQIYRALKLKYPYFVHKVTTEGWQSSVRHNLNSEFEKLFDKGRKDGKGWAWKSIPGKFKESKEDIAKKRKVQEAAQAEAKAKAAAKSQYHAEQQPHWQQQPGQPFQHSPGMPPNFAPYYGPNGMIPPPPNGMQWAPPPPAGGPLPPRPQGVNQSGPPFNPQNPHGMPYPPPPMQNGQYFGPPPSNHHLIPPQPPSRPGSAQQVQPCSQPPPTPQPAARPPQPAASASGISLPSNMPCTLKGIEAIEVFKKQMMSSDNTGDHDRLHAIFHSARRRVLHGAAESSMPEGERELEEEKVIMEWIEKIAEQHRNPNYVKPVSAAPTPAPVTGEVKEDNIGGGEKGSDDSEEWVEVDKENGEDDEKATKTSKAGSVHSVESGLE